MWFIEYGKGYTKCLGIDVEVGKEGFTLLGLQESSRVWKEWVID